MAPGFFTTTASTFGGPGDPGTGSTGYRGDYLPAHPDSFAELSHPGTLDFAALGNLPHGQTVTLRNPANGRIMIVHKRDVGRGGPGISGTPRGIDLWYKVAQQLGINGLGQVQVAIGAHSPRVFGAKGGEINPIKAQAQQHAGTTSSSKSSTTGGQIDWGAAGAAALMASANKPINTSGKVGSDDLMGRLLANAASGQYTTPLVEHTTTTVNNAGAAGVKRIAQAHAHGGGLPDVNPLPAGFNLGRNDQGVDASAAAGTPIRAINDSRVIQILPNWYKGQPLVLLQLTAGPNKGKYWYIAEQINHGLRRDEFIPRNATVAKFASSGTGLEIGWGDPNTNSRTLAGPHYHEGQVTGEGVDFRHKILHA